LLAVASPGGRIAEDDEEAAGLVIAGQAAKKAGIVGTDIERAVGIWVGVDCSEAA